MSNVLCSCDLVVVLSEYTATVGYDVLHGALHGKHVKNMGPKQARLPAQGVQPSLLPAGALWAQPPPARPLG